MSLAEQVKAYAKSLGLDIVGVSGAERLACEPTGSRPGDFLRNAKSMVVFGRKVPDSAMLAMAEGVRDKETGGLILKMTPEIAKVRSLRQCIYGVFGHGAGVNMMMIYDAYLIAKLIEDETGKRATPVATGPIQGEIRFNVHRAAVAAGLGELAWNGRAASPEYGPRLILGAVVTDAEIDPDPLYSGKKLCDPEKCHICSQVCPNRAISTEAHDRVIIGGKEMETAYLHKNRCRVVRCAMRKEYGSMFGKDYVPSNDPTDEEIRQGFRAMPPAHGGELSHQAEWKCDLCVGFCPIAGGDRVNGSTHENGKTGGGAE